MRGNLDYFSWFLEPNAPFEPATRIYTLADPEYNFWKSLQDPQNGHLKLVDSEYSDVDKERLQNERQKALDKFRNDIFLFYVVANILWMVGVRRRDILLNRFLDDWNHASPVWRSVITNRLRRAGFLRARY